MALRAENFNHQLRFRHSEDAVLRGNASSSNNFLVQAHQPLQEAVLRLQVGLHENFNAPDAVLQTATEG